MLLIHTHEEMADASAVLEDSEVQVLLKAQVERLAAYTDFDLSELAMFAIIQPHDTLEAIEAVLNRPLLDEAGSFIQPVEIIARQGGWYEVTFILSDDGYGMVLYVPIDSATEPRLLTACERAFAAVAHDSET
ncbi:hypothetical protein [Novosphingobium album (ex Hu et al. 2023)]|uniref:Uncharacterized protein n=1 Tax=Novosphingobium album (ex Hu et al. 2023) TaxID=2930093 RepID=A0ABT0B136_9SPHN|nr:hypothetical protein [Novosphingobium album (ex Hu et al. 2023)]MCJ2178593.1 hypothetical protein [Novosphingobium album (ex Hu et al. 2023)]